MIVLTYITKKKSLSYDIPTVSEGEGPWFELSWKVYMGYVKKSEITHLYIIENKNITYKFVSKNYVSRDNLCLYYFF